MPPAGLIDTGAILAILEADDYWHLACVEALGSVQIPLFTSEALLTEVFHLAGKSPYNAEKVWRFVRSGAVALKPLDEQDLPDLHALMAQYKDRPMDFADATLVHLAARESLGLILTVDFDDFETYRIRGSKRFTILPQR